MTRACPACAREQAVGPEVGEHVLDSPQAVRPWLDLEPDGAAGLDEVLLDVAGHQPAFLGLGVRLLEPGEIHIAAREGDAGGLLILPQPGRVDAVDLVEVVVEPPGVEGGLAEDVRAD